MPADTQNRDLTLPPDTYLYLQNEGKGGLLSVHRGPTVVNQTGQDQPVRYEAGNRKFLPCSLEQAVQQFPRAGEGDYVIIENPTDGTSRFPTETSQTAVELQKGRRINIPGPWSEALWPGQIANVIPGHRLRTNQYLIAIIYNSEEAEKNWETSVVEAQTETGDEGETKLAIKANSKKGGLPKPESFAVGTRIRIDGTDVSFYIPCTGVEVLKDEDTGEYVREAVTLEQMEYCCLVSESGKKKYPIGPDVVFPEPTEVFEKDSRGRRKFRPIELNTINGIHLKVTADFTGEDLEQAVDPATGKRPERQYREGTELFVTGKTLAIYYPREELAIIEYGQGNKKHFSTAVPKGEGRYVIDRETGDIELVRGPKMLLPDPRTQILVRRRLDLTECRLMYPGEDGAGNPEVIAYNQQLAEVMAAAPSGRSGVVSEGDYRKSQAKAARRGAVRTRGTPEALYAASADMAETALEAFGGPTDFEQEEVSDDDAGRSVRRGTKYTEPRQLDLNTKYQGAVKVEVWPGYAILVVGAEGSRRVEEGPKTLLLEYDEKLGHTKLSTGKPKTTDRLLPTAYLCVQNNQVGDIVEFESKDHVKGTIKISLRVNFEGETAEDKLRWFSVDNYVKYLCDHVRSIIAGMAKRHYIAEIKGNYIDLTRDAILGVKTRKMISQGTGEEHSVPLEGGRPGLGDFTNGMRVFEVEVLGLTIADPEIARMLDQAQHQVVRTNIEIEQAQKDLEATQTKLDIAQKKAKAESDTERQRLELEKTLIEHQLTVALARIESSLATIDGQKKERVEQEALTDISAQAQLARDKAEADQEHLQAVETQKLELESLDAATKAAVDRFNAAKDGLYEVMISLGRDDLAAKLAQGCTIERYLSGDDIGSSIANLLSFAPMLKQFFEKAEQVQTGGNGSNRLSQQRETSSTG